jgi:hypothetical protein
MIPRHVPLVQFEKFQYNLGSVVNYREDHYQAQVGSFQTGIRVWSLEFSFWTFFTFIPSRILDLIKPAMTSEAPASSPSPSSELCDMPMLF